MNATLAYQYGFERAGHTWHDGSMSSRMFNGIYSLGTNFGDDWTLGRTTDDNRFELISIVNTEKDFLREIKKQSGIEIFKDISRKIIKPPKQNEEAI